MIWAIQGHGLDSTCVHALPGTGVTARGQQESYSLEGPESSDFSVHCPKPGEGCGCQLRSGRIWSSWGADIIRGWSRNSHQDLSPLAPEGERVAWAIRDPRRGGALMLQKHDELRIPDSMAPGLQHVLSAVTERFQCLLPNAATGTPAESQLLKGHPGAAGPHWHRL